MPSAPLLQGVCSGGAGWHFAGFLRFSMAGRDFAARRASNLLWAGPSN